jgi:tRNA threonylcarbamoyladenosine biosynthesis protein TsaE
MKTQAAELTDFNSYARRFAQSLSPRADTATVVALSGDLGAGKTTFAQEVARALGIEEPVTSPTFVIEKIYALTGETFSQLIHIDAYRLNSAHELEVLGWEELVRDSGNLILIEWPEKVAELIPKDAIRIAFDIMDNGRIINIDGQKEN